MKLRRTVATYEACSANAVASGSKAQMMYFVEDAQKDIGTLADSHADLIESLKHIAKQWPDSSAAKHARAAIARAEGRS